MADDRVSVALTELELAVLLAALGRKVKLPSSDRLAVDRLASRLENVRWRLRERRNRMSRSGLREGSDAG